MTAAVLQIARGQDWTVSFRMKNSPALLPGNTLTVLFGHLAALLSGDVTAGLLRHLLLHLLARLPGDLKTSLFFNTSGDTLTLLCGDRRTLLAGYGAVISRLVRHQKPG